MAVKIYEYKACSTCRKAIKFLQSHAIDFEPLPIREQAPVREEIARMLKVYDGNIKKLFNTSGVDYRAQKLGEKLKDMELEEQIELLTGNGNLVKRPFLLVDNAGLVGFKEDQWKELFKI